MKTFAFVDSETQQARIINARDIEEARDIVTYHLRIMGHLDGMDWKEARKYVGKGGDDGNEFLIYETKESVWTSSTPTVARFLDRLKEERAS